MITTINHWLPFHHKLSLNWSIALIHKTLILSRQARSYCYYAASCVLIQSSPLDFCCRLCFYHIIISINDCMFVCFCMYLCYCLQHAVSSLSCSFKFVVQFFPYPIVAYLHSSTRASYTRSCDHQCYQPNYSSRGFNTYSPEDSIALVFTK